MLFAISIASCRQSAVRFADWIMVKLVRQPIEGLAHLLSGTALTVPPLCRAGKEAIVEAVDAHLTPADRAAIQQGIDQLKLALVLLAWPLTIVATALFWRASAVVQALVVFACLGLPL